MPIKMVADSRSFSDAINIIIMADMSVILRDLAISNEGDVYDL